MNAEFIDVHDELAKARVTRFHWRLGATMGALTLFDGYDTFNPAYVIHYVLLPWNLKPAQAGFLVSSGLIGFLIGAAVHGVVADRIGRRMTLLGGLWITSVFTLATPVLGTSFRSFCTIRLLTGLGLGCYYPLRRPISMNSRRDTSRIPTRFGELAWAGPWAGAWPAWSVFS